MKSSTFSPFSRLRPAGDAGLGLSELLIAMVLVAVVGGSVVATFTRSTDSMQRTDLRNRSTQELTVALEQMTKLLKSTHHRSSTDTSFVDRSQKFRSGDPEVELIGTTSGVETAFYANIGHPNGPALVHWYVDTDLRLIEEITPHDPVRSRTMVHDTMPVQRRILLHNVVMPGVGQRPLFSWFGAESPHRLNHNDPYRPLTHKKMLSTVAVQINLTVRPPNHRGVAISVQGFTQVTNEMRQLTGPPNWPVPPSDDTPIEEDICTTCGGVPPVRTAPEPGCSGCGGDSTITGPVAGLA